MIGKALSTKYAGVTFRSRTEARWAVFFNALKIKWAYEYEGFQLPSGPYVPDFYLYDLGWLEVKRDGFRMDDPLGYHTAYTKIIDLQTLLCDGEPEGDGDKSHRVFIGCGTPADVLTGWEGLGTFGNTHYQFLPASCICMEIGIEFAWYRERVWCRCDWRSDYEGTKDFERESSGPNDRILRHATAAQNHRFW